MQITVKCEPQGPSETLELDGGMALADFALLCCMQLVGEMPSEGWQIYWNGKQLPLDTAGTTEISNHFTTGATLILSKTPPKTQSPRPKKHKTGGQSDVLSDAMASFLQGSSSTSKATNASSSPLSFDFSSIKVKSGSASSTPPSTNQKVELTAEEGAQYTYLFNQLRFDPRMKAQFDQNMPGAVRAVDKNSMSEFLEYFRKVKEHRMEERKKMFSVLCNPDSKEAQEYGAKVKRLEAVDDNFKMAMEYSPEAFGTVFMLYINCKVNNCIIKAFIDSGAQMSIMSATMAQQCGLDKILDERFAGTAVGVGTQKILGKVHYCQLEISGRFFHNSFSILEGQKMEVILGLDFLKRHQASVDLKKNALVLPHVGIEAPFLNESELPASADMNAQMEEAMGKSSEGSSSTINANPESLKKLTDMGFSAERSQAALAQADGDFNTALALLM